MLYCYHCFYYIIFKGTISVIYNHFKLYDFVNYTRSLIYSFLIRGGKPTPFFICFMAMLFCTMNGYVQSRYLLHYYSYSNQWFYDPRFLAGILIFLLGLAINIQSDATLRGLRKPNETVYKTPRGTTIINMAVNFHSYSI